jgi:L-arabinose isomerase
MSSCTLIPLARPTFDVAAAQRFFDGARAVLTDVGATINGPTTLVMTPEDTANAEANLKNDEKLYILFNASFADASAAVSLLSKVKGEVLLWSVREFGEVGDRLLLNSMCGSNLAAHALRVNGKRITHLHGNPDEPHVKEALALALKGSIANVGQPTTIQGDLADSGKVQAALQTLQSRTIGAIGDAPAGFTPCNYDADILKAKFGLNVINKTIPEIFADIAAVSLDEESAEYQDACAAQPSLRDVPEKEARINASTRVALQNWIEKNDLSAIAMRCWPDFAVDLGACPCGAMGRTATSGTPAACERDVYGAVTMLLLEALGSGTNYLVDTVDLEEDKNIIRIWHCGSASTTLAVDSSNATQFIHCNRKLGVAGNFPLKTGPVVLVRLDTDIDPANPSKLRLVMTSGESLSAPNRFQGNTATVRTSAPARQLINGLIHNGFPHHTVVAWKDIREEVRRMAELLAIPLTEW